VNEWLPACFGMSLLAVAGGVVRFVFVFVSVSRELCDFHVAK